MERLIVNNPCNEQESNMQAVPGGEFCSVCETNIFDLTDKSYEELLGYKEKGYCVKMTEDQVDDFRFIHPFKRFAAAAFFVFGTSLFTVSYSQVSETTTVVEMSDSCIVSGQAKRKGGSDYLANQLIYFDIDGNHFTTTTDEDGKFQINLPRNPRVSMSTPHSSKRRHFSTENKAAKNIGVTKFPIRRTRGKF